MNPMPNNDPDLNSQLTLITQMINKARNAYYDTGIAAIMWGAVITVISLAKLAEVQFGFRLPFDPFILSFVAIIPQVIITIREKKMRRVKSYDDVAMDYVWLAFGISIILLIHTNQAVFQGLGELKTEYASVSGIQSDYKYSEYVLSLFLMLYGIPTFITGGMCKFRPMLWGGILCWGSSIVSVYTPMSIDLGLMALSAFFAWFVPGIILRQDYMKAKLKYNGGDV